MENFVGWITIGVVVLLNVIASVRNSARMSAIQENLKESVDDHDKEHKEHTENIGELRVRVRVLESWKEKCQ